MTPPRPFLSAFVIALGAASLALGLGPVTAGPALAAADGADAATCNGLVPTITVTSGQVGTLSGTEGDDVVVLAVPAPYQVTFSALGGDDTICTLSEVSVVDAGAGNDVVSSVGATGSARTQADLGDGDDTFVGGPGGDRVVPGAGTDTVSTGAGNDSVNVVGQGAADDLVDLGDGDDTATYVSSVPVRALVGGAGQDLLYLSGLQRGPHALGIDQVTRTMSVDGSNGPYDGFEAFDLYLAEKGSSGRFRGTDGSETLTVRGAREGSSSLVADLGGGDDALEVTDGVRGAWNGGPGRDRLVTGRAGKVPASGSRPSLLVDLDRGRYRVHQEGAARLSGFEDLEARNFRTTKVVGGPGAETILVRSCTISVSGGGGADVIKAEANNRCGSRPVRLTASGGPGDDRISGFGGADRLSGGPGDDVLLGRAGADVLRGGGGNDRLLGGTGRDTAYGDAGRNTCVAERQHSCVRS